MKKKLLEHTQWAVFLVFLNLIFVGLLPNLVVTWGIKIDQHFQLPPLIFIPNTFLLSALLILPSLTFAVWSTIGRGTPVPLMATQKLITQPPFSYCRNPMALGTIGMYLGVAVLFRSWGAVMVVLLGAAALLTYVKLVEEKEMAARFGEEYLEYKRQTPFLIPRFGKRR